MAKKNKQKRTNKKENKTTYSWAKSVEKNYNYKGKHNMTSFPDFIYLCMYDQEILKEHLVEELLKSGYSEVISDYGYVYAKGEIPVLLTAHMDTVHTKKVKDFYEYYDKKENRHIISSPQGIGGDDRCGIYMILEIIKTHKCSVLFCEDEEIGGVGSNKFCKTEYLKDLSGLKYLIELDRANKNDAVFYDCENDDFTKFITENTGYEEEWGSFSDISNLSPACGVASVNLSCGYYNAHTTSEYVVVEEMKRTIETVKSLLEVECEPFEYIESLYSCNWNYRCYNGYTSISEKDETERKYIELRTQGKTEECAGNKKYEEAWGVLIIYIYDPKTKENLEFMYDMSESVDAAFGRFFRENPNYCYMDVYDYEICSLN